MIILTAQTMDTAAIENAIESFAQDISLTKILSAAILLVVCMVFIRVIHKATAKVLEKSKIERSLHTVIRSTVKIVLIFISIMLIAGTIGIDTSSLLAVLSIAGLAVSLSIQDSLSNLVSAVMLLSTKPFKVDDFVEISGKTGTVKSIGIIYTQLATADNQIIYIPNSQITSNQITNLTAVQKRRVEIRVHASYDADLDAVKAALQEAASHPELLPDEPIVARVASYGEHAIEYVLQIWTTPDAYWRVYYDVLENVKRTFDARRIEMTYPHVNVHMMPGK